VTDRTAQCFQIKIPEDSLPVNINDPQDVRLPAVGQSDEIMLPVPAFDKVFGNFERDILVYALFHESADKNGIFERITWPEPD